MASHNLHSCYARYLYVVQTCASTALGENEILSRSPRMLKELGGKLDAFQKSYQSVLQAQLDACNVEAPSEFGSYCIADIGRTIAQMITSMLLGNFQGRSKRRLQVS